MTDAIHVLVNGDVRTMDGSAPGADAVAWQGDRLLAVGSEAEVSRAAGDSAEIQDVAGATVLPGFIDAHHHPSIVALYGGVLRLTPPTVVDIPSLQRELARAAEPLAPGEWLVATEWNEALLAERRPPTRTEIDDAVPDRPVMLFHWSCHRLLANSRALELAGIDHDTPDPSGGAISRGRGGVPNGLLIERAISAVESLARASLIARSAEDFLAQLGRHHRAMAAAGITRVVDATVPLDLFEIYREAARRELLIVPTVMLPVSTAGYLEAPWDVLDGPISCEDDDGVLMTGPVKLVFDGAPGCAMCLGWWQSAGVTLNAWAMAIRQRSFDVIRTMTSTAPQLGRKVRTGIQIYSQEEAHTVVRTATERGFALATHAIGNEAIEIALTAFEASATSLHRGGVPRLEHATFLDRELVERIQGVGAAVVTQPHFVSLPAYCSAPPIPGIRNSPTRWLLDLGIPVAGSSDHPVAGFDPLDGIRSAVSRRTSRGHVYEADQCVELDEALTMYTRTAAEVSGSLDHCGTLTVGKRADLVVLDGCLRDSSYLEHARVHATFIGGELVAGSPV